MKSGIYQIKNLKNNKIYIGSSVDIRNRWRNHLFWLRNNRHYNSHLQRSFNKYGEKYFEFKVLELVIKKNLIKHEQFYLNKFNPKFNIDKFAGSNLGFQHSIKTKGQIRNSLIGVKHSEERKKKNSLGQLGKKLSKVTIQKLKGKIPHNLIRKQIIQYNSKERILKIYENASQIRKELEIKDTGKIHQVCRKERKSIYGFLWRYA